MLLYLQEPVMSEVITKIRDKYRDRGRDRHQAKSCHKLNVLPPSSTKFKVIERSRSLKFGYLMLRLKDLKKFSNQADLEKYGWSIFIKLKNDSMNEKTCITCANGKILVNSDNRDPNHSSEIIIRNHNGNKNLLKMQYKTSYTYNNKYVYKLYLTFSEKSGKKWLKVDENIFESVKFMVGHGEPCLESGGQDLPTTHPPGAPEIIPFCKSDTDMTIWKIITAKLTNEKSLENYSCQSLDSNSMKITRVEHGTLEQGTSYSGTFSHDLENSNPHIEQFNEHTEPPKHIYYLYMSKQPLKYIITLRGWYKQLDEKGHVWAVGFWPGWVNTEKDVSSFKGMGKNLMTGNDLQHCLSYCYSEIGMIKRPGMKLIKENRMCFFC